MHVRSKDAPLRLITSFLGKYGFYVSHNICRSNLSGGCRLLNGKTDNSSMLTGPLERKLWSCIEGILVEMMMVIPLCLVGMAHTLNRHVSILVG